VVKKILDRKRRSAFRSKLSFIPHFKVWLCVKKLINAAAVGGISLGSTYQSYKLFVDEELTTKTKKEFAGTVKIYPIIRFNGRPYYAIKSEISLNNKIFDKQVICDIFCTA
jgi:hypothetical protein